MAVEADSHSNNGIKQEAAPTDPACMINKHDDSRVNKLILPISNTCDVIKSA